jgi:hypothetical protein
VANDDGKTFEAHMAMKQRMKGGPRNTPTSLTVVVKALENGQWCPCRCHTSMSSAAASPARTSQSPAEVKGSTGHARVFGASTPDSFASYDPATSSSKMSQDSSPASPSSTPATDAYAAGLIDGEGCVSLDKKLTLRVDVGMSSKGLSVLEWLVAHHGGTIRNTRAATEKWEAAQAWMILGDRAISFLRQISPYLVLKQGQAGIALALGDLRGRQAKTKTGRVRWSDEGRAEALRLREALMDLNRKGPMVSESCADERIALLAGDRWVTTQLDLSSEAGLKSFSGTWPRAGMTRSGIAFRLRPLAPLTGGIGSGLWGTPTARDWKDTGDMTNVPENGLLGRQVLNRESWPTPKASDSSRDPGQATRWGPGNSQRSNLKDALRYRQATAGEPTTGSLNPPWVAKLMGFPADWLDL